MPALQQGRNPQEITTMSKYILSSVLAMLLPAQASAGDSCKVVDVMPTFEKLLRSNADIEPYRDRITHVYPQLYNDDYVNALLKDGFTEHEKQSLAWSRDHLSEVEASRRLLTSKVPGYLEEFKRAYPKFECNFTFYIAPSFGHMDGSAAVIKDMPMIVFAPDTIPRLHAPEIVKVLIDHEAFHIYHSQATHGAFGSFSVGIPKTYQSLWSEGLATYASWQMNPTASLDDALLVPGIPEQATPRLAALAEALLKHIDDADPKFFETYFTGGAHPPLAPPRSGYYVGVLIARNLALNYSLQSMAELDDAHVRELVAQQLKAMASKAGMP